MSGDVWVLCATANGLDTLSLLGRRVPIKGIIGLTPRPETDAISNPADTRAYCRAHGLQWVGVDSYALDAAADRAAVADMDMDILLILGWQRLAPAWLLEQCRTGAIGVHGSHHGITRGRGRSPQNWALILGAPSFEVSIFFVEEGIDDGAVIDTRRFDYGPADDIAVSHHKVNAATAEMLARAWQEGGPNPADAVRQPTQGAYMPQRRPEDGAIDWSRRPDEIDRFVRALTRPYPGAYSSLGGQTLKVLRGCPLAINHGAKPGRVLARFQDGGLLVAAGEGGYIIREFELSGGLMLDTGDLLESVSFEDQMTAIIERHQKKYPNLPLAADILALRRAAPEHAEQ